LPHTRRSRRLDALIGYMGPDAGTAAGLRDALQDLHYLVAMQELPGRVDITNIGESTAYILIASGELLHMLRGLLRWATDDGMPVVLVYSVALTPSVRAHPAIAEINEATINHVPADFADLKTTAAEIARALGPPSDGSAAQSGTPGSSPFRSAPRAKADVLGPSARKSAPSAGPDVFISYASEDAERAQKIAEAIETCGWRVWWDRTLVPGVNFRREIARQLDAAKCVVVLWSKQSIDANFVLDEASHAMEREVLVQVLIDGVRPPLGFRQHHSADLTKWNGEPEGAGFPTLKKGISRLVPP
jgi:hypothetical protein